MKLKSVRRIEPELSRCISVDAPNRLFAAGGADGRSVLTHNSVIQRNIIFGCILRPDNWRFIGIDLKKVELSAFRAYSNVVLGIATELEDALTVLRFGQATMMKRYQEMEAVGKNDFMDMPDHGPALMIMIDEAGELLSASGVKALVGSTLVQTPTGLQKLKDLEVGDLVYDPSWKESEIQVKYVPQEQSAFEVNISQDSNRKAESFVAGAEHNWVAYFEYPDGEVEGPSLVDTQFLYSYKEHQDSLPAAERTVVKFRRKTSEDELSQ